MILHIAFSFVLNYEVTIAIANILEVDNYLLIILNGVAEYFKCLSNIFWVSQGVREKDSNEEE